MQAYSPSGSSNPMVDNNNRVGNEIDEKIGSYSKLLDIVSDSERPYLRSKLLSAKLMKEKLVAMTALAKAQNIIAEMDVMLAENNLKTALEQLNKYKEDHTEPAENKTSSTLHHKKPELKHNTPKELEKPASIETSNTRHHRVASLDADKQSGKNMSMERQKASSEAEVPKVHKARSATPSTEKRNKRSHSNSSCSTSHKKKAKKTKNDRTATAECKSTLTGASPSNSKSTTYNNKSVLTCNKCFQSKSDTENLKKARKTVDGETVLTADKKGSKSHRDAVNVSKALQKILTPKTAQKPKPAVIIPDYVPDLTKSPGEYHKQLLFEDEPITEVTKSKIKVKTEAIHNDPLNNSTENLVNGLFKDIMEAKSKRSSGTIAFSRHKLWQILEKC